MEYKTKCYATCNNCNNNLNKNQYNAGLFDDEIFIMCRNCANKYDKSIINKYKRFH